MFYISEGSSGFFIFLINDFTNLDYTLTSSKIYLNKDGYKLQKRVSKTLYPLVP